MPKEEIRQAIHISLFLLAFFLKYLNRFQAALLLLLLLFISVVLVPKMKVRSFLYRNLEQRYSLGGITYFLVLLVLVLIFPAYIVAASWAILALGDGAATLIGKNFKAKELPWNKNKSYFGSFAFLIFGTLGAFILLKWMMPEMNGNDAFWLGFRTSIVAAIVESLPLKINDNVSVAITSAVVMYLLS